MNKDLKKYEELTFADDFMFCKILQNNQDLCKELVEIILGKKIGKIIQSDHQKSIEITADGRGVRFDVFIEDDVNSVYDIEMQKSDEIFLPKRSRYYQGMIDLDQMERGSTFRELKKSVIIFICLSNPFKQYGLHKYTFSNVCREIDDLEFGDETSKIILSASGHKDDVSEELRAFLNYIAGMAPSTDFTERLDSQVHRYRANKEWRLQYMTLLEHYEIMREEGRKEGLEEGRKEGRKEEQAKTAAERERAEAAEKRVLELEAMLAAYQKEAGSDQGKA